MVRKVLLVEDNYDILEALQLVFELEGYEVTTAAKGNKAYKLAGSLKPDVIVLDMLLSGVNGLTVCNSLKLAERTKDIPVIMISAHPNIRQLAIAAGADDYVAKPFEIKDLLSRVKKYSTKSKAKSDTV